LVELMAIFKPCTGKDNCTSEGTHCKGCGRSHKEILRTRWLLDSAVNLALDHDYENVEDYADYLSAKIIKFVNYRRSQEGGA